MRPNSVNITIKNSIRSVIMVVLAGLLASCQPKVITAPAHEAPPPAKPLANTVGVTHVAGNYHLTDKDFLNEGADQILDLGSRVIKVWFYGHRNAGPDWCYPYNSIWPKANSLVDGANSPYYRMLFNKPFNTFILVTTSLGRPSDYWREGITREQEMDEERQFYELTKHLLTVYQGTGKTFILSHWEGDWMLRGHFEAQRDPSTKALMNMVLWLNARQAGVDKARQEFGQKGVHVYHAAEVNLVIDSMRNGRPNMVNRVLPYTNVDLVSYSAWDATVNYVNAPSILKEALNFIARHTPDRPPFGNKNVYIGEFGLPENDFSQDLVQTLVKNVVDTGTGWGCPYVVYWQLYCNELKTKAPMPYIPEDQPRPSLAAIKDNNATRGFWLIRPDGSKSLIWQYFHHIFTTP